MTLERRVIVPGDNGQVDQAVAAIRAGQRVVLPTETVFGLACRPSGAGAGLPAGSHGGDGNGARHSLHTASIAHALDLAMPLCPRAHRLATRYWPGPLTLVAAAKAGGTVGLRVPAHAFTQQVLARCGPLLLSTLPGQHGPISDPDLVAACHGSALDLMFEHGRCQLGQPSTVVDVTAAQFQILRVGILAPPEIYATAARRVLFLCTGNTCRSPLAAALCTKLVAEALGIEPGDLPARGLLVESAGVATIDGMPASEGSLLAAAAVGLDLSGHRSSSLRREHLLAADLIFCMSASHLERLEHHVPLGGQRPEVLDPAGRDIADPFGSRPEVYQKTCREIAAALTRRLPAILAVIDA